MGLFGFLQKEKKKSLPTLEKNATSPPVEAASSEVHIAQAPPSSEAHLNSDFSFVVPDIPEEDVKKALGQMPAQRRPSLEPFEKEVDDALKTQQNQRPPFTPTVPSRASPTFEPVHKTKPAPPSLSSAPTPILQPKTLPNTQQSSPPNTQPPILPKQNVPASDKLSPKKTFLPTKTIQNLSASEEVKKDMVLPVPPHQKMPAEQPMEGLVQSMVGNDLFVEKSRYQVALQDIVEIETDLRGAAKNVRRFVDDEAIITSKFGTLRTKLLEVQEQLMKVDTKLFEKGETYD